MATERNESGFKLPVLGELDVDAELKPWAKPKFGENR
jgi:hypothetical protein